jgi:chromate transporter
MIGRSYRSRRGGLHYHPRMTADDRDAETAAAPTSALAIFLAFTRASLLGFGGMLPQMFHELVHRRRWIGVAEFAETQAFGQALPGPALANISVALGHRWAGTRGALAALAGTVGSPVLFVIAIGYAYAAWGTLPVVQSALHGMSAVAAGLVAGMAVRSAESIRHLPRAWLFAAAAFVAIGILRWPFLAVMLALGPLSALLAWRKAPGHG